MTKSRETIEEEAIEIVDKLLQHGLIPTIDAVILIRAITDKGCSAPAAPQVYPTNIPNMPVAPNVPGPDYPWKPGIVYCDYCNGTGQNQQQWNTTIC